MDLKGKKVLIVEDDVLLRRLLFDRLARLREKGIEVLPTANAEEGLEKARAEKPDIVLLDLVLPGVNGFDFLERLRKDDELKGTTVAILSNLSDESDKARARSLGAVAYFVKADFSLGEISDAVEELLGNRRLGDHTAKEPEVQKTPNGYMIYL